jgi:RNA polymerase sigma-70 factor (sigma-E family)
VPVSTEPVPLPAPRPSGRLATVRLPDPRVGGAAVEVFVTGERHARAVRMTTIGSPAVTVTETVADAEADFDRLVRECSRRLLRSGYLLTGSWASAQDLLQTALVQTWTHWDRIREPAAAEAYVRTCMARTASSWWRRRWTGERPTEVLPESAGVEPYDAVVLSQVLVEALRRLDSRSRTVLVLRYVEDRSEAEVAQLLGISAGTVKSRASRAAAKLRELDIWDGVIA